MNDCAPGLALIERLRSTRTIGHFQHVKIQLDSEAWRTQTKEMNKHDH